MKGRRKVLLVANVFLGLALLTSTEEIKSAEALECDTGPECQCECLDDWDVCAEGLSTEEAWQECDPAYEACWDDNC